MHEKLSGIDVRLRVLAVTLEPALSIARVMGLSLDDLQALVADGYFRELRLRGLSLAQVARRLGKSARTAATLSKKSNAMGPLLDASRRLGWQREVVRAVTAGPLSREQLLALVPSADSSMVEETLAQMVRSGLLDETDEGFAPSTAHVSFARPDVDARLESLRHMLTSVAHVIYQRFFRSLDEGEALARVLSFSATAEQLEALGAQYPKLRDAVIEADGAAPEDADQGAVVFVVVRTPDDHLWRRRGG